MTSSTTFLRDSMPMNSSPSPVTATGWSLCTSCASTWSRPAVAGTEARSSTKRDTSRAPSSTACCAAAAISTPARRLPSSTGAYS
ncbi:Uncharacterised protein [Bordetella pertussis]|nr:Uncharacterised protein [Bordetella pertussis]CPI80760.1 Uncharacterised protein [Bordetella pertussis]CPO40335.1 Uncharacterised protein [Bordetella pertussis]